MVKKITPTPKSMKALREDGWHVEVVEHWIPRINIRRDLFGFADLLAIRTGDRPRLVQVTTSGVAARIKKIHASPLLPLVLEHFDIEVHGWTKWADGKYHQRIETIS
jgi:hypothetical protein